MSKELFVKAVTEGLSAPPKYFFMDAMINKNGYNNIDEVTLARNWAERSLIVTKTPVMR